MSFTSFSTATAKINNSSKDDKKNDKPNNPFKFPMIMLGTAVVLGSIVMVGRLEDRLASLFASPAQGVSILQALGGITLTIAHGHSMAMLGNARRKYEIPLPQVAEQSNVGFWNANRGYYNMVEHLPFFMMNLYMAKDRAPCFCGLATIFWSLGRILYTHGYAYYGPNQRNRGFMISVMSSMAVLGTGILTSDLMPQW